MDPEEITRALLEQNRLCTLATASREGKPEAATIQYAEDAGMNLYFETFASYRKYANIRGNPQASVVITQLPYTIQMDGEIVELSGREVLEAKKSLERKGHYRKFYEDPDIRFFRFVPSWIRLCDCEKVPSKRFMIRGA